MSTPIPDPPTPPSKWSDMASGIGWCFIWLGIGGCIAMNSDRSTPLVNIEWAAPREGAK